MKKITCELCGSKEFVKDDEFFICQSCGTKYTLEQAKKMMKDEEGEISTVKVDATDKINNLYELARRSRKEENDANAAKYYQMILIEEPNSWEANFYTVFFQERQCKIGEIAKAATNIKNCLDEVVRMIHNYEASTRQKEALKEVGKRCLEISDTLVAASINIYYNTGDMIRHEHLGECKNRVNNSYQICLEFGDAVEKQYSENQEIMKYVASVWEKTIERIGLTTDKNSIVLSINLDTYYSKLDKYDPEYMKNLREKERIKKEKAEFARKKAELESEIYKLSIEKGNVRTKFILIACITGFALTVLWPLTMSVPAFGVILMIGDIAGFVANIYVYMKKKQEFENTDEIIEQKKKELEELKKQNNSK